MQFTPYDKKKTTHGNGMISNKGTSIIVETASNFYMLLEKSCTQVKDNKEKYEIIPIYISKIIIILLKGESNTVIFWLSPTVASALVTS